METIPYLEDAKRIIRKSTQICGMTDEEFLVHEKKQLEENPTWYVDVAIDIAEGVEKGVTVEMQESMILGVLEVATKVNEMRKSKN